MRVVPTSDRLLIIALTFTACTSERTPDPLPGPGGPATVPAPAQQAPKQAPAPPGWWRVTGETNFVTRPKNRGDYYHSVLPAGTLVERRVEMRPRMEEFIKVKSLKIDLEHQGRTIREQGDVWAVKLADHLLGWTFVPKLEAVELPSRRQLCAAIAAGAPEIPGATCEKDARFVALAHAGGAPRFVVAFGDVRGTQGRVAVVDVEAVRAGQPAVRGTVEAVGIQALAPRTLSPSSFLLVTDEYVRKGNMTGSQHGLIVVGQDGKTSRYPGIPAVTSEPRGPSVTQRTSQVSFAADAGTPVLAVKETQVVQRIADGRVLSRRELNRFMKWDERKGAFVRTKRP